MSKQRYVSTSFWTDPWVQSLEPEERYIYLYLMTGPRTNIAGVYEVTLKDMAHDTGYPIDTISKVIDRFQKDKKAYYYEYHIILPTFPKHQKWNIKPKIKIGIESILRELKPSVIEFLKTIPYTYPVDKLTIPYQYPSNYSDFDFDSDSDYTPPTPHETPERIYGDTPDLEKPRDRVGLEFVSKILSEKYNSMLLTNSSAIDHLVNLYQKYGENALVFILDKLSTLKPKQYNSPVFVFRYIENRLDVIKKIKSGKLDKHGLDPGRSSKPKHIPPKYTKAFSMKGTDGREAVWWYDPDPIMDTGKIYHECIREDNGYITRYPKQKIENLMRGQQQ